MNRYLGIIKIYDENMNGVNVRIISKTYDDIEIMNKWFSMYPDSEHIMLNNTNELDSMFGVFRDMKPITQEEIETAEKGKILYRKLMKD